MEWRFESADQIYPSSMHQELMAALRQTATADSDFAAAEVIFGELVGNAIRHARGTVVVCFDWDGDFASLSVFDGGRPRIRTFELPADPLAESGRGLYIVKRLAREFTVAGDEQHGSLARATLPVRRSPEDGARAASS